MTALEKIRNWLRSYPRISQIQDLKVDYYSQTPDDSSIAPSGLVEVSRKEDVLGNVTVQNQYNFILYFVLAKPINDDSISTENAAWLLEFQAWVQEQSIRGEVPFFGDDPKNETIKAQNGTNDGVSQDGTTGLYTVLLSVNFTKIYKEE